MADTSIEWTRMPSTIDPRGYVLVRYPQHHRADIRGYVYEHVLVAEQTLGRPLVEGEWVRHLDGRPSNNRPENLTVRPRLDYASTTTCACGCGTTMTRLDPAGRDRRYVSGHNPHTAPSREAILSALAASPHACLSPAAIARAMGAGRGAARVALSKLFKEGRVERPRIGYYRLPGSAAVAPPAPPRRRPKRELGAGLSAATKEALTEDFEGLCAYGCGRSATTWDHLIPWSRGGSFTATGNAVPACAPCNHSKNDSPPGPWIARGLMAGGPAADALEGVICLAVSWGSADPDDFDHELTTWDQYPDTKVSV